VLAASLMMEAARTSETLVNFYQTTQHNNPEDSRLHEIVTSDVRTLYRIDALHMLPAEVAKEISTGWSKMYLPSLMLYFTKTMSHKNLIQIPPNQPLKPFIL
jgi:hypothetical protein